MSDLLLTFYGDDFTGSTDVMEALTVNGVRTTLFLEPPSPELLRTRFAATRAAGLAGLSRAMTPAEMDDALPPALGSLRALGAPMVHYKTCSTFDSSPRIGSIGRAIEIGRRVLGGRFVPLLVGAPALRRYCAFGNLFATAGAETFRIDRHPTMKCHPVTPMDEGDLRLHLARQTGLPIALMDLLALAGSPEEVRARFDRLLESNPAVVLFDVLDEPRLAEAGRLIWTARPPFVAGSSGIEYALAAHWKRTGELAAPSLNPPGPAGPLLAVSGSCSPATDQQIAWALENGFEGIRFEAKTERIVDRALEALAKGRSVVVYAARGPQDPAIRDPRREGPRIARELGSIAQAVLRERPLRRLLVAGGDTSGFVARGLGITALEMVTPLAPGSPLCRAYAGDPKLDGLEIALKGGQVGKVDYFGSVLRGAA